MNGLYLADRDRLVDNHTAIDHAKPHCGSHEVYKGILGGASRAVFNGKIIVRQDAAIEDLDTKAVRGLDKALFAKLAAGDWIARRETRNKEVERRGNEEHEKEHKNSLHEIADV